MWDEPRERPLTIDEFYTVVTWLNCPYCGEKHAITLGDVECQTYYCDCGESFDVSDAEYSDYCEVCGGHYGKDYMHYDLAGRHICDRCYIPDDDERWNEDED